VPPRPDYVTQFTDNQCLYSFNEITGHLSVNNLKIAKVYCHTQALIVGS